MNDGSKIAAAILAAEAAKQQQALKAPSQQQTGYDIPGELLKYYRHFLIAVEKQESTVRTG